MKIFLSRELVRASGGPRYVIAVAVDALGTGLLRPFLLLYGIRVLAMPATTAGLAITAGIAAGLAITPVVGRWLDRGARSDAVAASMVVRVPGVVLLLLTPTGHVALFTIAALLLGIGNQAWPVAHAALVSTVSGGRTRDAALAASRSIRNAGLGLGGLIATVCLAGGAPVLRTLAVVTAIGYASAAALAWSVHIRSTVSSVGRKAGVGTNATAARTASRTGTAARTAAGTGTGTARGPAPRIGSVLVANTVYAFCLNVPEVALPLVLVTQVHASPVWAAVVFVINTMMVVALQVGVTVWMSRFSRRAALTAAGAVLAFAYVGFLLATPLRAAIAAPAIVAVSVVCTFGEIMYAGSMTAYVAAAAPPNVLGRALGRLQLSTGLGLALSPAVMTALAARGTATLWPTLAVATSLAAALIHRSGRRSPTMRRDDVTSVVQEAVPAASPAPAVTCCVS